METVTLNKRKQSQLLGVLFAEYEILTTEQASMIRDQMKRPLQVFANTDSLWAFYNFVTNALQSSHPKTWMEDQRILHYFISTIGNFQQCSTPAQVVQPINTVNEVIETEVDPNQINLLDAIAEAEAEQEVVQEEVENEEVLHQYEEEVEDVIEDIELPFDIDADDDAVLDSLLTPCDADDVETEKEKARIDISDLEGEYTLDEMPAVIETIQERIDEAKSEDIFPQDETVVYTDPVGNTFEAPVVTANFDDEFALKDNFDLDFNETEEEKDNTPDFF
jgi:hypothetical protein